MLKHSSIVALLEEASLARQCDLMKRAYSLFAPQALEKNRFARFDFCCAKTPGARGALVVRIRFLITSNQKSSQRRVRWGEGSPSSED